jgi:REP element-mobilizing transposase RayT
MPNHVHAIVFIEDMGRGGVTPPNQPEGEVTSPLRQPTLGEVIAFYKYETTKKINEHLKTPGKKFWQRNYYERVVRNDREYEATHNYIVANPMNWDKDEYRKR